MTKRVIRQNGIRLLDSERNLSKPFGSIRSRGQVVHYSPECLPLEEIARSKWSQEVVCSTSKVNVLTSVYTLYALNGLDFVKSFNAVLVN